MSRYRAVRSARLGLLLHDRQCKINMGKGGTSGCDPSILSDDPSLVQKHRGIVAKRRPKPPTGRRQATVKDTGLGQEEGSRAGTS